MLTSRAVMLYTDQGMYTKSVPTNLAKSIKLIVIEDQAMSVTTNQLHSSTRPPKRHTVLKGLVFIFLAPYICLASCLGLYLWVEHVPRYFVPEVPPVLGVNTWSVIQQRFIQLGDKRISLWQGAAEICEVPSDACTGLSNAKVLEQIVHQYDGDWETIWSDSDWRRHLCHDSTLINHKVDVVIRRPWLGRYVPTLCVGVARSGQGGFKIMVTTINPSFQSGWE